MLTDFAIANYVAAKYLLANFLAIPRGWILDLRKCKCNHQPATVGSFAIICSELADPCKIFVGEMVEEYKIIKDAVGYDDNGAVVDRGAVSTNGRVWLETPSRKYPNPT